SSFYNSLKKLERLGLLQKIDNSDTRGKKIGLKSTSKAQQAIRLINQLTLPWAIPLNELLGNMIPELIKRVGLPTKESEKADNLFILSFDGRMDPNMYRYFKDNWAKEIYILADDLTTKKLKKRGMTGFNQSRFLNKIREANDFFDGCCLYRYRRGKNIYGIVYHKLLKEVNRVMKPGEIVVAQSLSPLPKTGNIYVDSLSELYSNQPFFYSCKEEDLKQDLSDADFENLDSMEYKGVIFSWGNKPE
ncbi:MAG: hypothetical protein ACFE9T_11270, partial [Promethearchaeota archaeon]